MTAAWGEHVQQVLADGQWHDGITLRREAEKLIPPGVALRQMETNRARSGPTDRLIYRKDETLIRMGQRSLTQALIADMLRTSRRYVTDPSPLTRTHWRGQAPWSIKDRYVGSVALSRLATDHHITTATARQLLTYHPEIERIVSGRTVRVLAASLTAWAEAVQAWRDGSHTRRSIARRIVTGTLPAPAPAARPPAAEQPPEHQYA